MKFKISILFFLLSGFISAGAQEKLTSYIDPMIGTAAGSTFPGATVPFGMVQLSPDTDNMIQLTAGYHYSQNTIVGFSHTHMSGVGVTDLYDVLFMPFTGPVKWSAGTKDNPDTGYRSRYSHGNESARAGYYQVHLSDYNINAELTATEHAGFHRYTFNGNDSARLMIDMSHRADSEKRRWWPVQIISSQIKKVDDYTVQGYRIITGWARMRKVYFYARFSKPIAGNEMFQTTYYPSGRDQFKDQGVTNSTTGVQAVLNFNIRPGEQLLAKVGISAVSSENAKLNLDTEIKNWDFDGVAKKADALWEKAVSNIKIDADEEVKKIFYTGLYHAYIHPNNIADVNGDYLATDFTRRKAPDKKHYSTFSLWDTYRAVHPLYTILQPKKNAGFINSMIRQYETYGYLPIWQLWGDENYCMIGNHAVTVIVDALLKGQKGINVAKAYEAVRQSSLQEHRNSPFSLLDRYGYYPQDIQYESVSKTLENSFTDWSLAQLAKKLGKEKDYQYFIKRAQSYKNLYDKTTGFFRGKNADGSWVALDDPVKYHGPYTEGNAWIYLWYVPQDVGSLVNLMGGRENFITKLDSFFTVPNHRAGPSIGQYWLLNEPSHHITYLYNYVGKPWKTQKLTSELMKHYNATPAGIPGEEDCGQMSAWYIFNALGFYPVDPASGKYDFGSPKLRKATIELGDGKKFVITTKNLNNENIYIQSVKLNGKEYPRNFLHHDDILKGGALEFEMGAQPNFQWAEKCGG